jgi:hypothetical protein
MATGIAGYPLHRSVVNALACCTGCHITIRADNDAMAIIAYCRAASARKA